MKTHPNYCKDPPKNLSCRVAIIGSGPGGAVTASVLSSEISEVCLFEAGSYYSPNQHQNFSKNELQDKYRNSGMNSTVTDPAISFAEGKCVGGGSEVNSALYGEINPACLSHWLEKFDIKQLSYSELQSYYKKIRSFLTVSTSSETINKSSKVLAEGAKHLNWTFRKAPRWYEDPNSPGSGKKQTMTRTYLPNALNQGTKLIPETRIHSLTKQENNWILQGLNNKRSLTIQADTVFLCCGATQTPTLLKKNNLGKNVGSSIRIHTFMKVIGRFDQNVNTADQKVGAHQITEFSPQIKMGCSINTKPHMAVSLVHHPNKLVLLKQEPQKLGHYYVRAIAGNGTLSTIPTSKDPLIQYKFSEQERMRFSRGLKDLCRCLFSQGAQEVLPAISPSQCLQTMRSVDKLPVELPLNDSSLSSVHLFGACPMGENRKLCTVDSFGNLHGHKNIVVSDSSILPDSPGTNPQSTIMAIAQRNAEHFLE